ncbi:MAG: hypothetical protein ACC634_04025, partial [Hyphomicrobiales bacterium]
AVLAFDSCMAIICDVYQHVIQLHTIKKPISLVCVVCVKKTPADENTIGGRQESNPSYSEGARDINSGGGSNQSRE